jgi:hypothetical protein
MRAAGTPWRVVAEQLGVAEKSLMRTPRFDHGRSPNQRNALIFR